MPDWRAGQPARCGKCRTFLDTTRVALPVKKSKWNVDWGVVGLWLIILLIAGKPDLMPVFGYAFLAYLLLFVCMIFWFMGWRWIATQLLCVWVPLVALAWAYQYWP